MLKTLINSAPLAVLGLLLGGSALVSSCAKEEQAVPDAAVSARQAAKHTGEELYRGIFFFEGTVASKIPALDSYRASLDKDLSQNPELLAVRHRSIDAIVQATRALDPTYFDRLQQAIRSRDFQRVKEAIRQGSLLNEAVMLQALPSPTQKQDYLQRKQILQGLDRTRYDFSQEQGIARYVQDARAALAAGGQKIAPTLVHNDLSTTVMIYQVGDHLASIQAAIYAGEVAYAYLDGLDPKSTDSQLKVDLIIRQIALNLP